MKKKLLYLLLLFGILFCIKINVNAKEILSSDISPRTYVIGTHEFTESTTLSTRHIMLASKTIVGNTLDDMIIYYKNPRGKWINGLTGEIVEVSEKFNIEYVDLVKELEKPTLTLVRISGTYGYLSISEEGYYSDEDHMNQISGWEVYEKTDNGYARVYGGDKTEYYISLKEGEEKNFVAIAYKLTSTLDKKYSAYSNEVGMIGKKLALPTLTKVSETADKVVLSFVKEGNYTTAESLDHITGWSLYLTNSESIEDDLIKEGAYNETTITLNKSELPDKDNLELYLIVYLDHEEDRYTIYSDSSNIVMVTKNNLQTPTLTATYTTDKTTVELSIIKDGAYNSSNIEASIDGWELYEKTESGYKLEVEGEFNAFGMPTSSISGKTYIARVYKLNSSSNKIYSDYSNEITIEDVVNMPKMPTLANLKTEGKKTILSIAKTGYYKGNANISDIAGWELYEINELGYYKVGSSEKSEIEITISKDETKAYAARTFKTSSNGNVYSNYSTGLVVTGKFINAPILSITYKKGTVAILSINEDGYYSDPNNLKEITGLELWKVEKNESTGEVINTSKVEGCEALTECAIKISYNHSDEYFARVYNIDKNNYEVYSEASNNLEVEAELLAPVLKNMSNDNSYAKLSAAYEDNEVSQSISGYEFYEKTTSGYAKLYEGTNKEYNIYDLIPNISRTFIVKSYILQDNNKIYSNSSNELVITRDKVETPTLTKTLENEESVTVAINSEGYYKEKEENIKAISGWELYEVENGNYTKISDVERDKDYTINLTVGKSITLSSRTYITNPINNEKVYSDYSNEITRIILGTPTLSLISTTATENTLSIAKDGYYSDSTKLNEVTKVYYYKVNSNNENELISECDGSTTCKVNIPYGTTEKFNAVVYYKDSNNNEMYSKSSNTLEIVSKVPVPTLEGNLAYESYADLVATYSDENVSSTITGYDFYRVEDDLIEVCSGESQNCAYSGLIPQIKKTFVVKAYVLDNDNNKIYSDESNRVEVLREKIVVPQIQITKYKDSTNIIIEPYSNIYSKELVAKSITGIQIYKVENSKYTLLEDFRDSTQTMGYFLEEGETLTLAVRAYLESGRVYYSEYGMAGING